MINHKQLSIVILLLVNSLHNLMAQRDTIWYDATWKVSTKKQAAYYRPPIVKKDDLYLIRDFYSNGTLQMEGTSQYEDKDFWQGKTKWYDENGKLLQIFTYVDNRLEGEAISFYKDQKLKGLYTKGRLTSGQVNMISQRYNWLMKKEDTLLVEVAYDQSLEGIRIERYYDQQQRPVKTMSYDGKGNLIGTKVFDNINSKDKGVEVQYYYNPMRVKKILDLNSRHRNVLALYHPNGKLREEYINGDTPKIVYYDENGNTKGSVFVSLEDGAYTYYDGTKIRFYSNFKLEEISLVYSTSDYDKDGKIIAAEYYHENQQLKSKIEYKNGQKSLEISYNKKGDEIARITYDGYRPYEGTLINKDRKEVFKEGKLVKEVNYYPETTIPFKIYENYKATFYDPSGAKMGEVTSKKQDYFSPLEGKEYRIDYKGKLSRISEYKEGVLIHEINIRYFYDDSTKIGKEENFYDIISRNTTKKIEYYHDVDRKRNEIIYSGYSPKKEIYFDRNGKEIGSYDHANKEGILIKYFYDSDQIKVYEERKDGKLVKRKEYIKSYNSRKKQDTYTLVEDSDINKKAIFYNKDGQVIAEATFKNGKPWQGSVFNNKTRELFTIKEGKREGLFQQLDYNGKVLSSGFYKNDQKEGEFIVFDYNGNKKTVEQHKAGKREGKTTYFNPDGTVASSLLYKNDLPYEGKEVIQYGSKIDKTEKYYKEGKVQKEIIIKNGNLYEAIYIDDVQKKVTSYFKNSKQVKYTYQLNSGNLHGEVTRYDKKGNPIHVAKFKNGRLQSGSVLINENRYGYTKSNKMLIKQENNEIIIEAFNEEGVITFELKEKKDENGSFRITNTLGFDLKFIYENRLY
ncbi:toxin-antitoxin system YwqK family antitoxin [Aquimarina algicola]|uniref:Toxin-antitoxin system YwqK family antitoxin n=1 Tax=Aquimarina algicola TaxID=2589995 RepID=A0A504JDD0_9FLAO|nr:hypothetical protein [Aquimarina algicola]TPN88877.1 hypothetical protein FHK87_01290 [Aquimarina algicola]